MTHGTSAAEVLAPRFVRLIEHGLTRSIISHRRFTNGFAILDPVLNVFFCESETEYGLRQRRLHVYEIFRGRDHVLHVHGRGRHHVDAAHIVGICIPQGRHEHAATSTTI